VGSYSKKSIDVGFAAIKHFLPPPKEKKFGFSPDKRDVL
jgi:hypothetical protein